MARWHLVPGFDRPPYELASWGAAVTLEDVLDVLGAKGVEVEPR